MHSAHGPARKPVLGSTKLPPVRTHWPQLVPPGATVCIKAGSLGFGASTRTWVPALPHPLFGRAPPYPAGGGACWLCCWYGGCACGCWACPSELDPQPIFAQSLFSFDQRLTRTHLANEEL